MASQLFILKLLIVFCQVSTLMSSFLNSDAAVENNLEEIIDNNINRLMELRKKGWGWSNTPEVILALQLSKQERFLEKSRSIKKMKQEIKNEIDDANIGKLALYAMAVKSVCLDPRDFAEIDILQEIEDRIHKHHGRRNWYIHGLALQALCVNNVTITEQEVERILAHQKNNGRFGSKYSTGYTAQMLLALKCILTQRSDDRDWDLNGNVTQAIDRAATLLTSKATTDTVFAWNGNKYFTPVAMMALAAVDRIPPPPIGDELVKTLRQNHDFRNLESEGTFSQRLPALRESSVLDLMSGWQCLTNTGSISIQNKPNFDPEPSFQCSSFSPPTNIFERMVFVSIDVRLSVITSSLNFSVVVENVKKDNTLLQVMAQARCQNGFRFSTTPTSFGPFITSVHDIKADSKLRQYWSMVNAADDQLLQVGVKQYLPSDDEHIVFKLTTY